MKAWLAFFRAVNLPTVPGDVFAGAAVACALCPRAGEGWFGAVLAAAGASVLLYMFGLADNDIAGAGTDEGRPIPLGLVSMRAARIARAVCLAAAAGIGWAAGLPVAWWAAAGALAAAIVVYNRTKRAALMGLCRGLDVVCGGAAAVAVWSREGAVALGAAGLVWTAYIAAVTRYSEGEETDPARKRRVGVLIGALAWLQLVVVAVFAGVYREWRLVALQAGMVAALAVLKRLLPEVSAS